MSDIKTIDYAPVTNGKHQLSPLGFVITTSERDYLYLALTSEEKKEFITNLRKVCTKKKNIIFFLLNSMSIR